MGCGHALVTRYPKPRPAQPAGERSSRPPWGIISLRPYTVPYTTTDRTASPKRRSLRTAHVYAIPRALAIMGTNARSSCSVVRDTSTLQASTSLCFPLPLIELKNLDTPWRLNSHDSGLTGLEMRPGRLVAQNGASASDVHAELLLRILLDDHPAILHNPACRTNPGPSPSTRRSRVASVQLLKIWGSSRPPRRLCDSLNHALRASRMRTHSFDPMRPGPLPS